MGIQKNTMTKGKHQVNLNDEAYEVLDNHRETIAKKAEMTKEEVSFSRTVLNLADKAGVKKK